MLGLTSLGAVHTAISLVAVAAGIVSFVRFKEIAAGTALGKIYIWTTVLSCLTGFGIFQHGGFGAPHLLGILTLAVLAIAYVARLASVFGDLSKYVETLSFSTTFFFHMIPGATETFTRLPPRSPLFSGPDDPVLQKVIGAFFVVLLIGAALQVRRLRALLVPSVLRGAA